MKKKIIRLLFRISLFYLIKFFLFSFLKKISNSQFPKQKYFYDKSLLDQSVKTRSNEIKYAKYSAQEIYDLEYMKEYRREEQVFYFIKIIYLIYNEVH
jgi:hypothetical protein